MLGHLALMCKNSCMAVASAASFLFHPKNKDPQTSGYNTNPQKRLPTRPSDKFRIFLTKLQGSTCFYEYQFEEVKE